MQRYKIPMIVTLFLLVSCDDGSNQIAEENGKAMNAFKTQKIRWAACDPSVLGEYDKDVKTGSLHGRVLCANMRVPLDYAQPAKGEASVALLKVSAGNPAGRLGMLTFNSGGPGGDGLRMSVGFGILWAEQANPQNPYGKKLRYLSDSYDLVGFSPRGLGGSTQLYCGSNETYRELKSSGDRSATNVENMLFNAKLTAQACAKNPLTPYINTDATARDMELMRILLHSPKLNYLGYSYGTWLGKWYDSLFPESVGNMVLDGVMDFTGNFDSNIESQAMGKHRLVVMEAANYGLSASSEELYQAYLSLDKDIREIVFGYWDAGYGANALSAAISIQKLRMMYPGLALKQLKEKLKDYTFVADDYKLNLEVYALAEQILDDTPEMPAFVTCNRVLKDKHTGCIVQLLPREAVWNAIVCNDTATNKNANFWITQGDQLAQRYFFDRGGDVTNNPCIYWPESRVEKPPAYNPKSGKILLIQSEWDGATVAEGARKTFQALPHASLIFVENDSKHGLFPYNHCVNEPVVEYLSTGKLGPREIRCKNEDDAVVRAPGLNQAMPSESEGIYRDPVAAQKTIDQIRKIIQRNSLMTN